MDLAAVIDWFSRYVRAWLRSHTLDGSFCLEMREEALGRGRPEVVNTGPGVQFTAQARPRVRAPAGEEPIADGAASGPAAADERRTLPAAAMPAWAGSTRLFQRFRGSH
jgi:putative transposase